MKGGVSARSPTPEGRPALRLFVPPVTRPDLVRRGEVGPLRLAESPLRPAPKCASLRVVPTECDPGDARVVGTSRPGCRVEVRGHGHRVCGRHRGTYDWGEAWQPRYCLDF